MRRTTLLLAGIVLLGGCSDELTITEPGAEMQAGALTQLSPAAAQDLASLRAATAPFHRIEVAKAAGYDVQFPAGCFSSPAGGMGFHYLNGAKVGTLAPGEPQLVIYEPQKNGTLKLVGVEFILPGASTDVAPVLFGQTFEYNSTFEVWALHVWAWKNNAAGMFSDWNPNVSCEYANLAQL